MLLREKETGEILNGPLILHEIQRVTKKLFDSIYLKGKCYCSCCLSSPKISYFFLIFAEEADV